MDDCLDEGTIQSFIDGELPAPDARRVGSHLATCESCAGATREARGESVLLTCLFTHDSTCTVGEIVGRVTDAITSEFPAGR